MTASELHAFATAVEGLVGLLALWGSLRFIFWPTVTEECRLKLFTARRELFVLVVERKIDPCHPAYVLLRSSINSLIFYADRVVMWRALLDSLAWGKAANEYAREFSAAVESIEDPAVKEEVNRLRRSVAANIAHLLILRSASLWPFVVLAVAIAVPLGLLGGLKAAILTHLSAPLQGLQAEAKSLAPEAA